MNFQFYIPLLNSIVVLQAVGASEADAVAWIEVEEVALVVAAVEVADSAEAVAEVEAIPMGKSFLLYGYLSQVCLVKTTGQ